MAHFFVIGSARSGGYLVYGILCSDPDSNPVLTENHFVSDALLAYSNSRRRLDHEKRHFFTGARDAREFYSDWITSFLERIQSRYAPAKHLIIKSILLGPCCPNLHEIMPDAKFIMSMRDPRDIVASLIEVGERQQRIQGINQYPRDADELASIVMRTYAPCLTCRDPGFDEKIRVVKYERLVTDPSSIIAKMEAWTGLDLSGFDPSTTWPRTRRDFSHDKETSPFITEPYGEAITAQSVGRFTDTLSGEETATVERICAPIMQAFEYPPSEPG